VSLGRAANEKMLIAESQEAMKMIRLFAAVNSVEEPYKPNDVLLLHGQFEKKAFAEPPIGTDIFGSPMRGMKSFGTSMGSIPVHYFMSSDKNLKSFLKAQRLGIFLFTKNVLFVRQEKENRFKIKFVCRCCEVHWDFAREHGNDTFLLWAPFGQLTLKVDPGKGSTVDFEKRKWKENVGKFGVINEADEAAVDDVEMCFVSWVGRGLPCSVSREFHVKCKTKTEAIGLIKNKLNDLEVHVETKANPQGGRDPLINVEFQTFRPSHSQKSDVISDVELK
jgi:hypothetical protein